MKREQRRKRGERRRIAAKGMEERGGSRGWGWDVRKAWEMIYLKVQH